MRKFVKSVSTGRTVALLAAAFLSVGLTTAVAEPKNRDAIAWRSVDITLAPHIFRGDKEAGDAIEFEHLTFRGAWALKSKDDAFGGISALTLSNDGRALLAASDRGQWLTATIQYNEDGSINIPVSAMAPIAGPDGKPLSTNDADIESLTMRGGVVYVGFEREHRIDAYALDETGLLAYQSSVATFPDEGLKFNAGLEALTALPAGDLIAISETTSDADIAKAWHIDPLGVKAPFQYKAGKNFSPTDLTHLGDGVFVTVERAFSKLTGVRIRLTRFSLDDVSKDTVIEPEKLVQLNALYALDNFEALGSFRTDDDRQFLMLISDDNFHWRQRTLLVLFELKDKTAEPGKPIAATLKQTQAE